MVKCLTEQTLARANRTHICVAHVILMHRSRIKAGPSIVQLHRSTRSAHPPTVVMPKRVKKKLSAALLAIRSPGKSHGEDARNHCTTPNQSSTSLAAPSPFASAEAIPMPTIGGEPGRKSPSRPLKGILKKSPDRPQTASASGGSVSSSERHSRNRSVPLGIASERARSPSAGREPVFGLSFVRPAPTPPPPQPRVDPRDGWIRQLQDYRRIMTNAYVFSRYIKDLQSRAGTPEGKHLASCPSLTNQATYEDARRLGDSIVSDIKAIELVKAYNARMEALARPGAKLRSLALEDAGRMFGLAPILNVPEWVELREFVDVSCYSLLIFWGPSLTSPSSGISSTNPTQLQASRLKVKALREV